MLVRNLLGARYKETPKDCTIASHALMMKGGYIKYMSNGSYSLFNPTKRITSKIEKNHRRNSSWKNQLLFLLDLV